MFEHNETLEEARVRDRFAIQLPQVVPEAVHDQHGAAAEAGAE